VRRRARVCAQARRGRSAFACSAILLAAIATAVGAARAQTAPPTPQSGSQPASSWNPPVMDDPIIAHILFDQLEGRTNGPDTELRWDGQGWIGTDWNKLWFKSEGFFERGRMTDGIQEMLYDRPIPFLRYFDWQAGLRYDGDSGPPRYWGALGIEGLAPEFFDFEATLYARDAGHFAARVVGSYDILITNRLIAQPEAEMLFYTKADPARAVGTGFSELDAGLRIRYEISRKFAPYLGFAYTGAFGETADFTRNEGGLAVDPRFVFGTRVWY
jgi:copper resistance protein B